MGWICEYCYSLQDQRRHRSNSHFIVSSVVCEVALSAFPLHVLTDGLVPPQKLTTPFTISPARCSPPVSAPEPAPSNPRCCLPSAWHNTAPDSSTAQKNKKKIIIKKSNTYIHTRTYIDMNTQARLKSSHLPPRSTNLLYRCTADFSTWLEQTHRDSEERDLTPPQNNKRKRIKLNSCIREIRVCLHTEFMLGITGL